MIFLLPFVSLCLSSSYPVPWPLATKSVPRTTLKVPPFLCVYDHHRSSLRRAFVSSRSLRNTLSLSFSVCLSLQLPSSICRFPPAFLFPSLKLLSFVIMLNFLIFYLLPQLAQLTGVHPVVLLHNGVLSLLVSGSAGSHILYKLPLRSIARPTTSSFRCSISVCVRVDVCVCKCSVFPVRESVFGLCLCVCTCTSIIFECVWWVYGCMHCRSVFVCVQCSVRVRCVVVLLLLLLLGCMWGELVFWFCFLINLFKYKFVDLIVRFLL